MDAITQQIKDLLNQQASSGPGLVDSYESSLGKAADQSGQSIGQLGTLYNDKSKFEKPVMGALGLGLMAPTKSGRFGETMYNAMSGAMEASNYNREQNLTREEKLAKLAALQGELTRQRANDSMDVFDKRNSLVGGLQTTQGALSDINLGEQKGPRPLNSGEFGPEAPGSDPLDKAKKIYNDYLADPSKFTGPQGQSLVKNALDVLKNERTNSRYEKVAGMRRQPKAYVPDAGTKKAIRDATGANVELKQTLSNLETARKMAENANTGYLAKSRGSVAEYLPDAVVPDFIFGSPDQGRDTNELSQIMDLEAIKGVGAYLKGPTSDRDVKLMLDTLSDPNATVKRKQDAIDRVMSLIKSQIKYNTENNEELKSGSAYGLGAEQQGQGQSELGFDPQGLPPDVRNWVQEQLDGGADPNQVIQYLQENYGAQ